MDALGKCGEHFSSSPNFPSASITQYTHAKHEKFLIFFGFYFLFIYFELGTGLASLIKMYEPETTQRRDSFSIYLLY